MISLKIFIKNTFSLKPRKHNHKKETVGNRSPSRAGEGDGCMQEIVGVIGLVCVGRIKRKETRRGEAFGGEEKGKTVFSANHPPLHDNRWMVYRYFGGDRRAALMPVNAARAGVRHGRQEGEGKPAPGDAPNPA